MNRFYGKYRGTVVQNVDPEQRGRIQALVPDVSGLLPSNWAMPCVPFAGKQSGVYVVPQIGAGVWIEFEQGDPDYPIWVGCFWGSASLPIRTGRLPANPERWSRSSSRSSREPSTRYMRLSAPLPSPSWIRSSSQRMKAPASRVKPSRIRA